MYKLHEEKNQRATWNRGIVIFNKKIGSMKKISFSMRKINLQISQIKNF